MIKLNTLKYIPYLLIPLLVSAPMYAECIAEVTYEKPRWNRLAIKKTLTLRFPDSGTTKISRKGVTKIKNIGRSTFAANYGGLWHNGPFSQTISIYRNQKQRFRNEKVHSLECTDAVFLN